MHHIQHGIRRAILCAVGACLGLQLPDDGLRPPNEADDEEGNLPPQPRADDEEGNLPPQPSAEVEGCLLPTRSGEDGVYPPSPCNDDVQVLPPRRGTYDADNLALRQSLSTGSENHADLPPQIRGNGGNLLPSAKGEEGKLQRANVEESLAKGEAYASYLLPADGEKEFFLPPQRGADSSVIAEGILSPRNGSATKGLLLPIDMVLLLEYCKAHVFDPSGPALLLRMVQEHADDVGYLLPMTRGATMQSSPNESPLDQVYSAVLGLLSAVLYMLTDMKNTGIQVDHVGSHTRGHDGWGFAMPSPQRKAGWTPQPVTSRVCFAPSNELQIVEQSEEEQKSTLNCSACFPPLLRGRHGGKAQGNPPWKDAGTVCSSTSLVGSMMGLIQGSLMVVGPTMDLKTSAKQILTTNIDMPFTPLRGRTRCQGHEMQDELKMVPRTRLKTKPKTMMQMRFLYVTKHILDPG